MAIPAGCLCVVLTLCMVGSPQGAAFRTGSPHSSSWWNSQTSSQLWASARQFETAGDLPAAERLWERGSAAARQQHDTLASIRYLTSLGACRVSLFHYRAALEALLEARNLALSVGDREDTGAIAVNLSSLYLQMWDLTSALGAAQDGVSTLQAVPKAYFRPYLLLQLGRLHERLGDQETIPSLVKAIEEARAQGNIDLEAVGWDLLGEERLAHGMLRDAEAALSQAYRLRLLFHPANLGFSYAKLGAVKLAEGDLRSAERLTERAAAGADTSSTLPAYLLAEQRGQIQLARGNIEAALADFSSALDLTERWRLEVLPALSALTSANTALEQTIFQSFVENGADWSLRTGSQTWAAETWKAVELDRAASLRESLALADVWRRKLPPEYWETLGQLRSEDARALQPAYEKTSDTNRLRLKLTEMEASAGGLFAANKHENFRSQTSLTHIQKVLRRSEILLSFHIGKEGCYLWALTREALRLYRLPPAGRIEGAAEGFREAVRTGNPEAGQLGQELYFELFGQLRPEEAGKPSWLLSLEGPLFELPFAALVTERKDGRLVYLVERHSLQVVPGAFLLQDAPGTAQVRRQGKRGWFLGVSDPIYNVADPRWDRRGFPATLMAGLRLGTPDQADGQLGRLVASADEVESAARGWMEAGTAPDEHPAAGAGATPVRTATVLDGTTARRDNFLKLLAAPPAVIHLATHVLTPPERQDQAFLAFGLGSSARPEFLTTSDVAMLHVPGSLVVMTGCATAAGDVRAGAGLLGLTRAWQISGAGGVVATGWPVKDSSQAFFSNFYRALQTIPAAEALRSSQVEMIQSGTWRSRPAVWASYQLTGGER